MAINKPAPEQEPEATIEQPAGENYLEISRTAALIAAGHLAVRAIEAAKNAPYQRWGERLVDEGYISNPRVARAFNLMR